MSNDVLKFDPSKLMDGVKDRIKATFVSLIPDDQWEGLVQKEVDAFFNERIKVSKNVNIASYGYKSNQEETSIEISRFRQLVWQICEEKSIEVIKEKFLTEYFTEAWGNNENIAKEKMKEIVSNSFAQGMNKFFESIVYTQMDNMRQMIRNMH